ncbi:MAG: FAD-dependent oxidoreductase [Halorhabdus sp.]
MQPARTDVVVVGGGVAGLMAGIYTARHDFETRVFDTDESLLNRNAHLENVPGFPAGINARLWLELLAEQAERAGAKITASEVTAVEGGDGGAFRIETAEEVLETSRVVLATKNTVDYLDVEGVEIVDRGKTFLETDERGRTAVEGCYAAGRLAGKPHQAAIAAGHGAEVGVTLLEDADVGFYHDWIAPAGYFTGRDREIPPGCVEIDDAERVRREKTSLALLRERLADPDLEAPDQHPRVTDG